MMLQRHILLAVVHTLQFWGIKDPFMQSVARSVWLVAAGNNINFQCQHIPGILNTKDDTLSHAFDPSCDLCMNSEIANGGP